MDGSLNRNPRKGFGLTWLVLLLGLVLFAIVLNIDFGDPPTLGTRAVAEEDKQSRVTEYQGDRFEPPGDARAKRTKEFAASNREAWGPYGDADKVAGQPAIKFALYTSLPQKAVNRPVWVLLFRNFPDRRIGSSVDLNPPEWEPHDIVVVIDDETGGGLVVLSVGPGSFDIG